MANSTVKERIVRLCAGVALATAGIGGVHQLGAPGPAVTAKSNTVARAMFRAWYVPFYSGGVIHGDPHLGNYTVFEDGHGRPARQAWTSRAWRC